MCQMFISEIFEQVVIMGRKKLIKNSVVVILRIEQNIWDLLEEIAEAETNHHKINVSRQELIRDAVNFVYADNERLRECFRRSRHSKTTLSYKKNLN